MKTGIEWALRLLIGMLLVFVLSLYVFEWVATDPNRYDDYHARLNIYSTVGISADELKSVQQDMATTLKTGLPLYNRQVTMFNELQPIFNEREMMHMQDVTSLFELERNVRMITQMVLLMLAILYIALFRAELNRRTVGKALTLFLALGGWLLLGLIYAASCGFSFDSAFIRFHEILFTNDLWLLDPRTCAMIRMYPEQFFMWIGRDIALWMGGVGLFASTLIFLVGYPWRQHEKTAN